MQNIQYYRDSNFPVFELKSCSEGIHSSRKHAHEELSIGIIEKGTSNLNFEGKSFRAEAGHIVLIPPEVIHMCNPGNYNDWQFKMIYLKPDWLQSLFDTKLQNFSASIKRLNPEDFGRISHLFNMLAYQIPVMEKESYLIQELDYFLCLKSYPPNKSGLLRDNRKKLQLVRDYLHDNFLDRITLDDLAGISGLSKYNIIRLFESIYKISPHSYLTILRINFAKKELKKDNPIADIAATAGFCDQSHFSKIFKQYTGITPLNYRQS